MGNVRLIQGEALETMKTFPDASFDLIATDPPYFKVKDRAEAPWDHAWASPAEYIAWIGELCAEWQRILKPNGSLYVFASPDMAARVEVKIGEWFNVLSHIVWAKPDPSSEINNGAGRGGQACKEALRSWFPVHERIIFAEQFGADTMAKGECQQLLRRVFQVGPLAETNDGITRSQIAEKIVPDYKNMASAKAQVSNWILGKNIPNEVDFQRLKTMLPIVGSYEDLQREYEDLRREYEDLRRPFFASKDRPYTDVWTFATVPAGYGKHICEKPVPLMAHIVQTSTRPGAEVLDCFMGSGSTGEACLLLPDRRFTGIEADPLWYGRSEARLSQRPLLMIEEDAPMEPAPI